MDNGLLAGGDTAASAEERDDAISRGTLPPPTSPDAAAELAASLGRWKACPEEQREQMMDAVLSLGVMRRRAGNAGAVDACNAVYDILAAAELGPLLEAAEPGPTTDEMTANALATIEELANAPLGQLRITVGDGEVRAGLGGNDNGDPGLRKAFDALLVEIRRRVLELQAAAEVQS